MRKVGVKVAEKTMGGLLTDVALVGEITITRYGKPAAILVSVSRYAKLLSAAHNQDRDPASAPAPAAPSDGMAGAEEPLPASEPTT